MKVVFFGTTAFSKHILDTIIQDKNFIVSAVVTIPDKASGRGLHTVFSPIKNYALAHNLSIYQPEKLNDNTFVKNLAALGADVFVVVAFRILPKIVWKMAPTFNLHTSLLPQYRGAAPIERALMDGTSLTGVSTFFLQDTIDTGDIILQEEVNIAKDDDNETLSNKLSTCGATIVIKTLNQIRLNQVKTVKQDQIIESKKEYFANLKYAHKLAKNDYLINWEQQSEIIYNQIRALSPKPGAYTFLPGKLQLKIFKAASILEKHNYKPGSIILYKKNTLYISTLNGFIEPLIVQMEGKRVMTSVDFLNGYRSKIRPTDTCV